MELGFRILPRKNVSAIHNCETTVEFLSMRRLNGDLLQCTTLTRTIILAVDATDGQPRLAYRDRFTWRIAIRVERFLNIAMAAIISCSYGIIFIWVVPISFFSFL
jgi:hypothetical protein